jgi:hypothetical protein
MWIINEKNETILSTTCLTFRFNEIKNDRIRRSGLGIVKNSTTDIFELIPTKRMDQLSSIGTYHAAEFVVFQVHVKNNADSVFLPV